jgi:hypothetical protein
MSQNYSNCNYLIKCCVRPCNYTYSVFTVQKGDVSPEICLLNCTVVAGDKIEKNEMGGACSTYGGMVRRVQGVGGET